MSPINIFYVIKYMHIYSMEGYSTDVFKTERFFINNSKTLELNIFFRDRLDFTFKNSADHVMTIT